MILFTRREKLPIKVNIYERKEKSAIDIYLDEYKIVTDKISSLSLQFASGSYIIPVSLIIGVASINIDNSYVYLIMIVMPILLYFYVYNHIRYMTLQFRLSGYAKHLENKINELVKEKETDRCLLWENSIARNDKQNYYEGFFLGITYFLLIIFLMCLAYDGLYNAICMNKMSYGLLFLVSAIYYFAFFSIVFFLLFFAKAHDLAYQRAKDAAEGKAPGKKGGKNILRILIVLVIVLALPTSLLPMVNISGKTKYDPMNTYDYIVVLGNKSEENQPSEDMKKRLDCLLDIIDENDNCKIVLSGGNGEAELMEKYLTQNDVKQQMLLESNSADTYENFTNVKAMVNGRVLVVTSDYHVFRSTMICKKLGLNYDFITAKTNRFDWLKAIKECFAAYMLIFR